MPPGITPPLVMNYNASTVPILQLSLSSPTLSEQELGDLGMNFMRIATGHRAGRGGALALRREDAAGDGRPQPGAAAVEGTVAAGRGDRGRAAEPDPARRHVENRPVRIQRRHERQPADTWRN